MKIYTTLLLLCCAFILNAQQTLFQTKVAANSLSSHQKISAGLSTTYNSTEYFKQSAIGLSSDLSINLPGNRFIKADFKRKFSYSNRSESSVYSVENYPLAELVLSQYEGIVTGMLDFGTGEKVIFHQTDADIFAVSVVDEARLIQQDSKNDFVQAPGSFKVNSNICQAATPVCANTTIDVMVVYTTAARTAWGGVSQSNSFIATAITNFNTALINSGVTNATINLVYSGETAYAESGNISTDLSRLRTNNDSFMDDVLALRTTYGADLCALVTSTPSGTCGLGYLNTNPTNYSGTNAFTVSLYNCVVSNYTLAHEMGHNMGLNHDWFVSQSTTPCEHHHGYSNQAAILQGTASPTNQRWRTIMAYNDECANAGFNCTRLNRWANPALNYNGQPTGIAIGNPNPSDEVFGFKRFVCVVSQFMPTAVLRTDEIVSEKTAGFSIYPNPAKEEINVVLKTGKAAQFKIVTVLGQTVLVSTAPKINIQHLPSGEYFLNIYDKNNGLIGTEKFMVR